MGEQHGIRRGQTAYCADGTRLGRVLQCEEGGFFIEKGILFAEDYWVEYEEVASVRGEEVRLRCPAAALVPETEADGWDPPRDLDGTAAGTDLEPLRAGMSELDEDRRRARALRGGGPLPRRGARAWRDAMARQARAAEGAPRPPRPERRRVARPVATDAELEQRIGEEVEDFEREAACVPRRDLLAARAAEEAPPAAEALASTEAPEGAEAPAAARARAPHPSRTSAPALAEGAAAAASGVRPRRLDFRRVAPEAYAAMSALERHLRHSGLERPLLELVRLRASQLNGCAFCVDMHSKDARLAGESEQRLYALPVWRDTPFFTPRERAALGWTEAMTQLGRDGVDDETYAVARQAFGEKELVELTLAVVAINGWNRLAIAFRSEPGSYRPAAASEAER